MGRETVAETPPEARVNGGHAPSDTTAGQTEKAKPSKAQDGDDG